MIPLPVNKITISQLTTILEEGKTFLLLNPPVRDFRLEWPQWHQPLGLLQIGSWLLAQGKSVQLIDCLHSKNRLKRQKVGVTNLEGYQFNTWQFGISSSQLRTELRSLMASGWKPDTVLVTTLNSIWWESSLYAIEEVKKLMPDATFVLGGAYPTREPIHATVNTSPGTMLFTGALPDVQNIAADLSLYKQCPSTTGIYFYSNSALATTKFSNTPRPIEDVVREIAHKAKLGVREFVFFDELIHLHDAEYFGELLEQIGKLGLGIRLALPGNISPRIISEKLAKQMLFANVEQVYFHCEMKFGTESVAYADSLSDYQIATDLLIRYGEFRGRNGSIAAMVVVGLPYEDLEQISKRLIQLAHIVGSVTLIPFQYVPSVHNEELFTKISKQQVEIPPDWNGKLFPLARLSGKSLEEYLELVRLTALLNSKYRSRTFDFLGEGFAASIFRESIRNQGWNPFLDQLPLEENENEIQLQPSIKTISKIGLDHDS